MFRVTARKAEFCLQRNTVSLSSFQTLFDRILRRVNEIINELELVVIAGIFDRENLLKHLVETFVLPVLRGSFELEEILEGLQLHFEKVRILKENL